MYSWSLLLYQPPPSSPSQSRVSRVRVCVFFFSPAEPPGEDPRARPSLDGNSVTLPASDVRQLNPTKLFHGLCASVLRMAGHGRAWHGRELRTVE